MSAVAPFERRYSGRTKVIIRWVPEKQQYVYAVSVDGMQVNACSQGYPPAAPYYPESPEGFDEAARAALSFTAWELGNDPEMSENRSGLDQQDFENVLEHDEDYEIVARRTSPTASRRHRMAS